LVSNSVNAAAPKAGAKCTKVGEKSIAAGLTYTCVKSGSKLVWSKGVRVVNSGTSQNSASNNSGSGSGQMKVATLGASCSKKDEKASIPNGTAICVEEKGKLIWQKWNPNSSSNNNDNSSNNNSGNNNSGNNNSGNNNSASNNSGNSNSENNNNGGLVTLNSPCPKKGETGPIKSGTAICALSNGSLVWISVGSQPVPADGKWIFFAQGTENWNTDLPPDGWDGEPSWFQSNWDIPTTIPIAPKCTSNSILTNYITDIDGIDSITPQGFMQPGAHALPVPHMYYNAGSTTEKDPNGVAYRSKIVNMYAPADMTLYGAAKLTYTMADGYKYSEWMMTWHFCGTYWMFNAHAGWLAPEVQSAIDKAPVKNCQNGGQINSGSLDCYSSRFAIRIKAGTLYAKSSGRAHGFDFGFTDASAPIPTRINPRAYAPRWSAGLCHIKFYPTAMQAKIESKLIGNNGCGQLVSDVEGTPQGVWLAQSENRFSAQEDYHIALAKHWSDKDLLAFTIGWNSEVPGTSGGVFTFKPNLSGPNNKPFTSVKNGEVMCYDNLSGRSRNGEPNPTFYIKLTTGDTEKLTIATSTSSCGSGPYTMPSNSQTFQRKVK
jgi:hypothetical protein